MKKLLGTFLFAIFIIVMDSCSQKKFSLNETIKREGNECVMDFNHDWHFFRYGLQADGSRIEEPEGLENPNLDVSNWRKLSLPHDFAIEGPFRFDLSGNTGRLPYQGLGWYRKDFSIDKSDIDKQIYIDFDGVMANAKVWLNGEYVGSWPYGYASMRFNLTPFLKYSEKNVLVVRTDTENWGSRWYPGAGIYRNVWLVKCNKVHVDHWGTYITTPEVSADAATVKLKITVRNDHPQQVKAMLQTSIYGLDSLDRYQEYITSCKQKDFYLDAASCDTVKQEVRIHNPRLWDLKNPERYVAVTHVWEDGQEDNPDVYITPFGIRSIKVSRKNGVLLNGHKVEIKGVCNHHDLGALGAAFNKSALQRQLTIMHEMGCNSIRTSHNPPAPELLELADKMGFLIMDEAFDAWRHPKREGDYSSIFEKWHKKDLQALIERDRNHPSVAFWSIGNEVLEQTDTALTKHLVDIVKAIDPTRPVTNGYNNPDGGRASGAVMALDVMGVNYFFGQQAKWDKDERYEEMPTIGTETSSCVSSRGEYYFDGNIRANWQISSYDVDHPGWGCTPDKQFQTNAEFPHLLGEYVWTGFDYLGEPTPYNSDDTNLLNFRNDPKKKKELEKKLAELRRNNPPSRSSYFGIVDLAGFPKDRYYMYQAHWRPDYPMAHILPHWNWAERKGKIVPVHVYTSGDEAELFVNGESYGRKKKEPNKDFRLVWDNVVYEPGQVRVQAYKDGKEWAEDIVETTGDAVKIDLRSDRFEISNDGYEYAFITIRIVDREGRLVPTAKHPVQVEVSGTGELVATDNGDAICLIPFKEAIRPAFNGLALAIVRSKVGEKGTCEVKVTSKNLDAGIIRIETESKK